MLVQQVSSSSRRCTALPEYAPASCLAGAWPVLHCPGWCRKPSPVRLLQNEAASCDSIDDCTFANAFYTNGANPHVINGALVEFSTFSDTYHVRTICMSRLWCKAQTWQACPTAP